MWGGINAIAQNVGRHDVVMTVDHVEVVAVDRVSLLDEAIKTGLQVQGVDRSIMLIGHYAHARIITRETSVLKVGIGYVIAIIGGTAKHVFLEVPPAWAYGRIVYTLANWLAAIVKQVAAVVDLFDNGEDYCSSSSFTSSSLVLKMLAESS